MCQQSHLVPGSCGGRCDFELSDIGGYLVFRARPGKVPITDQAALDEGSCPECHIPLTGDTGTWCPQCLTFWQLPAWLFELLGRQPPDDAPQTPPPWGLADLMAELAELRGGEGLAADAASRKDGAPAGPR